MHTPKKLLYILLGSIFLSGFCVTYANNENPDEEEKEEREEEEDCPDNNSSDNGSISLKRPFGKIPWEDKPGGRFNIMRVKPSPLLVTPEALRYNFWGDLSISSIDFYGYDYSDFTMSIAVINHLERMYVYDFHAGESTAVPRGSNRSSLRRLVLEDADGNPVLLNPDQNPIFYVNQLTEYYGDGSCRVFDYETRNLIRYCDENGRIIDLSNSNYGVEVIRDENSIRQVKASEGLADVVVLTDESYAINYYTYENSGTKDAGGYYQPIGAPYKTFKLENIDPEPDSYNHIRITETQGDKSWITDYKYDDAFEQWEMIEGSGLRKETKYLVFSENDTEIFIRELRDKSGNVVSKTRKTVKNFSWDDKAKRLVEVVKDPDGIALTKTIDYYDDPQESGRYGNEKETINADGSWIRYDYDAQGRKTREITPWLDSPADAPENEAKVTEYAYTPVDINDVPLSFDKRPRIVTEKTLGIVTARTFHAYLTNAEGEKVEIVEQAAAHDSVYGDPENLKTVRTWYASTASVEKSGRLKSVVYPNGRVESYDYTLDSDAGRFTEMITLQAILNDVATDIAYESTRTTKTWDFQDNFIEEAFFIYSDTDYELVTKTTHTYDDQRHLLESVKDGRPLVNQVWENGELILVIDESGTETRFSYDALKRTDSETKVGHGTQPDVITLYTRDLGEIDCGCDGKLTKIILAGDLSLETLQEKDPVGRVSLEVDASGYSTSYDYANSGQTVTKVNPNTSTVITDNYLDGRLKSVTGDGVVHKYYTYGVNADGTKSTRVDTADANYHEVETIDSDSKLRFVRTTTDMLGRLIKEERPAFKHKSILETTYIYDGRGLLARQTETGMADTLFEYDRMGDVVRSGLDMDINGQLDLASADRITDNFQAYQLSEEGTWYNVSKTVVYPFTNRSKVRTISTSKRQLSRFSGNTVAKYIDVDIHGNRTSRSTRIRRADKTVTERTDTPFSSIDAKRVIVNGLLVSENTDTIAAATTYRYDALERLISVKEPRHTNRSQIEYYTGKDQIFARTDAAGNTTTYKYYLNGKIGAGRVRFTTNALGQRESFRYNKLGQQRLSWGDAVYPQKYGYNGYGELKSLTTWRDTDDAHDFSAPPWPNLDDGDTTVWNYDISTGLLKYKEYADGSKVRYNYNEANRLSRRTWAREEGLHTIYRYSRRTGELIAVDYEDPNTADITYRYDRLGRQTEITDATGKRTFSYDPDTLQLISETLDSDFYKGHALTRSYNAKGRPSGYALQDFPLRSESFAGRASVNYSYDTHGHLSTIFDGSDTFTYGYLLDSNLLASITAPQHSVSYTYEGNRDVMTTIDNQVSEGSISKYEYTYDALGRRSDRLQSGSAINSKSTDTFNYNNRSEVIGSYNSVKTAAEWNPTYSYDKIGNRISSTGFTTATYTANALNQYDTFTPDSSELKTPDYDADGNLLSDGGNWSYTWNNENRLTSATDGKETLSFTYDYQGRLVKKDDDKYIEIYIYDGWNCIATCTFKDEKLKVHKAYLWGLDLSRTLQGAGGVGGLLKESEYNSNDTLKTSLFCLHDANGNIMQKLDSEGEIAMSVAYDPFGNIIEGKLVGDYGFSTKLLVDDLNWYYYGYRYYNPVTGRWPNRDPIGEYGGLNLYVMVENKVINQFDYLGLKQNCCGKVKIPTFHCCADSTTSTLGMKTAYYRCQGIGLDECIDNRCNDDMIDAANEQFNVPGSGEDVAMLAFVAGAINTPTGVALGTPSAAGWVTKKLTRTLCRNAARISCQRKVCCAGWDTAF